MKRTLLTLAVLAFATLGAGHAPPASADGAPAQAPDVSALARTAAVHREALRNPFKDDAFNAYVATLPRDGDFYVVEGDMLLTEEELKPYLTAVSFGPRPADPTAELVVALRGAEKDIYQDSASRALTYAVARPTFPTQEKYDAAVQNMREAAKAWVDACPECGVSYKYLPEHDAAPSNDKVNFTVRYHDSGGEYIAAAFFPHYDASRRYVNLDPSYFGSGLKQLAVGVLRHELGHTLGYRHEHIQDAAPGCANEKAGEKDRNWLPLTPYDSKSVMHYFCGLNVGGALNPRLSLSSTDVAAHREQYKPKPTQAAAFDLPNVESAATPSTLDIHRAAFARPGDEAAVKAFVATLPKDGDYFVVEGDLKMTEQELRLYLRAREAAAGAASPGDELPVNHVGGERDIYRNRGDRDLTYAIDRASFPSAERYDAAAEAMKLAAKSWQDACQDCGLKFTHLDQHDAAPSNDKVNFTVRYHDSGGSYVAASFFPHDAPPRRFLDIDPSFFGPGAAGASAGVLRHQLGHALGYRHAQAQEVAGCRSEGGRWLPLTPYNAASVMHYWCEGGPAPRLELTDLDRQAHRKTYRAARWSRLLSWVRQPELVIKFEGGDVAGNAAAALAALRELGLVELDRHRVERGETVEEIYKDKLSLPFFSAALKKLAGDLNRTDFDARAPRPGDKLLYPDVSFEDYEFSVKLDTRQEGDQRRLKELLAAAGTLMTKRKDEEETGLTKLTFKGFELRVPLGSAAQAARLREMLKGIPAENLIIVHVDPSARGAALLYLRADGVEEAADRFMQMVRQGQTLPSNLQGFLGSFAGLKKTHPDLKACARGAACPDIVLVDTQVELHPDIAPAIKAGGSTSLGRKEMVAGDNQIIELGAYDESVDHGTYMAGIIASQDNSFGLIGIHPAARITSADWVRLQNDQPALAEMIERRDDLTAMQIYVFASEWQWGNTSVSEDDLIANNAISRKIRDISPLWITAAGQDGSGTGQNITKRFPRGPMNLGFLRNVLVVTAYRLDNEGVPRLLPDANYSTEGLVHIAAPGKNIPSTISVSKYAMGEGTSPATAFVAGVASAMVSKWDYYTKPERVKFRLQLTSAPSLPPDAARKVAAGLLDPYLALLDPTKAWLKNSGGDYVETTPTHWCAPTLRVVDKFGAPVLDGAAVETSLIYRLYRVNNTNEWFVYTKVKGEGDAPLPGVVRRIGPGRLVLNGPVGPTSPIFGGDGGSVFTPAAFGDLLLSQGLTSGVCQ